MSASHAPLSERLRGWVERIAPGLWTDPRRARQRQFIALGLLAAAIVGSLWLMFSLAGGAGSKPATARPRNAVPGGDVGSVTNIGVMAPGEPVSPEDQWVGNAGRKLAQYESDKEEQGRINRDTKDFEASTMKRFSELEQRLTANAAAQANGQTPAGSLQTSPPGAGPGLAASPISGRSSESTSPASGATTGGASHSVPANSVGTPTGMPPERGLPPAPNARPISASSQGVNLDMPPGMPPGRPPFQGEFSTEAAAVPMVRVSLASSASPPLTSPGGGVSGAAPTTSAAPKSGPGLKGPLEGFLPVSFTRGILLGGLDAPTGGQAQSNPQPVLIRLSDTSVLPNQFRADYKECFVIASGYGDISSERAYMRTGVLSCLRKDGQALEVDIEGNVYGEDGKYGVRGKLVSKQGQMLANALLAGVVSGIGQGFATANTTYSTSALGTIATTSGSQAYRAGIGTGVGRALDRLAQYYIKLAEQTFPVIEVDAGREIDVVITRGVRIDAGSAVGSSPSASNSSAFSSDQPAAPADHYFKVQDEDY